MKKLLAILIVIITIFLCSCSKESKFGAEQFVSDIHKRVKGNCATQAFGRTNAIEITKEDFRFVPAVYKTMLTRLKQGEYIIQNPVFRSMLNVNFPLPIYKYYD